MALLKIARMGHPVLTTVAEPVPDPGAPEIRRLVADMFETMEDAGGTGLAAPQVHVPLRLFVFMVQPSRASAVPDDMPVGHTVVINPEVIPVGEEMQLCWEGCLSIPGLRAAVPRHARVRYRGVDCDGAWIEREVAGFHADVVQHEFDHLNGVLYPMRVTDYTRFGFSEEVGRAEASRVQAAQQQAQQAQQ
jgi:peptide deformylase